MQAYAVEFTVHGKGHFPLDMLRYDGCYPRQVDMLDAVEELRFVAMCHVGAKNWKPTIGRWESFGWTVPVVIIPRKL